MIIMSMAKLVFVDTWAWLALANRNDSNHKRAVKEYKEIRREGYRLVTSDYVLDEVITALFRNVVFATASSICRSFTLHNKKRPVSIRENSRRKI